MITEHRSDGLLPLMLRALRPVHPWKVGWAAAMSDDALRTSLNTALAGTRFVYASDPPRLRIMAVEAACRGIYSVRLMNE